ncbi:glycosyltransferase family 2 protein [Mobilicoccus pelagius]|uniref:Putative glycosyltransferase n=1 Tax=Mobilicoccus pelagius NBRC 104925 TaxID=1089455 RepID=H5UQU8_9MICO|nr:glycosyltransferase family 2 protein [Mobilicoccus pelagius]GAB48106.1 putative glycosyltransferase [Mobilicoccus pelagius NBRC 104925]
MGTTVSVCVPVYQGERYVRQTLHSVLDQEGVDFEVVVVDNASTDRTKEILATVDDPRVRVLHNEVNVGLTGNFRRAVEASTGEFVKICCADDLLLPGCLAVQAQVLNENPDIAVVAARRRFVDDHGILTPPAGLRGLLGRRRGREVARRYACTGINPVGEPAGVMFRRRDYDAVGGWNEDLPYPSDLATWLALLHHGDLYGQAAPYAVFRIGRAAHSQTHEEQNYRENRELMRRVLADDAWSLGGGTRTVSQVALPVTWALWRLRRRWMFRTPPAETPPGAQPFFQART